MTSWLTHPHWLSTCIIRLSISAYEEGEVDRLCPSIMDSIHVTKLFVSSDVDQDF